MFYFHVTLQVLESLICVTVGKIFPCPPQEKHFPTDLTDLWQTDEASHLFRLTGIKLTPLSRAPSLPIGWEAAAAQGEQHKCGAATQMSTETSSEPPQKQQKNFSTTRSTTLTWLCTRTSLFRTA